MLFTKFYFIIHNIDNIFIIFNFPKYKEPIFNFNILIAYSNKKLPHNEHFKLVLIFWKKLYSIPYNIMLHLLLSKLLFDSFQPFLRSMLYLILKD